jgi:membrane protease YdiL (CAAX protease family)
LGVKPLVIAILLLVAVYLPAFILVSVLVLASPAFSSAVDSAPWLPVPLITAVTLGLATLLILKIGGRDLSRYGFSLPRWSSLWRPLLAGLVFGAMVNLAGRALNGQSSFLGEPPLIWGIMLFWIAAPVQEETIFRGLFQGYLEANMGGFVGAGPLRLSLPAVIGAAAFSIVHLGILTAGAEVGAVALTVVGAFLLGMTAGHFRAQQGSLIGPIVVHALFNVTGVLAAA